MSMEQESRSQLLDQFDAWNQFIHHIEKLGEPLWNQNIGEGKWSAREVVAHIARWDDYFFEEAVAKAARMESLTVKHLDYDTFNEISKAYGTSTDIRELAEHAVSIRRRIISVIEGLSVTEYEDAYTDADGHPFQFETYLKDFIWHDRHHMDQIKRLIHFKLEEMSLNGWPALQTTVYDGWLIRTADGYTKRSNSVQSLYGHTLPLELKIRHCETLYNEQKSPTVFKITPFAKPVELDDALADMGYESIDRTCVKTVALEDADLPSCPDSDISLEPMLTELWLDAVAVFNRLTEEQKSATRNMLTSSSIKKCYGLLYDNGIPVACGFATLEQGWVGLYDVVTDSQFRNKGYGEKLIRQLLGWAKREGATHGYLLVVKANEPANRLYDKIGYIQAYDYWYRVKACPS
ncbi:GNAT family N-acetyltransferase [Paenibacillus sp. YIM B09110]|uniref:GNAT family N-acetyltransferase n=1 Tax=Paenibacillus sp. YIM B09110 TaxID=3126102 RepID=UPI00301C77EA